jgi:hypothetical protein
MRVKLTVHLDGGQSGVEGLIIEFQTSGKCMSPREAVDLFREIADQYKARVHLQTPAKAD